MAIRENAAVLRIHILSIIKFWIISGFNIVFNKKKCVKNIVIFFKCALNVHQCDSV